MNNVFRFLSMFLMILFFFSLNSTFAYEKEGNGSVNGIIVDGKTGNLLTGASAKLTNTTDSTMISGAESGADGKFTIININNGKYKLEIFFTGYKSKFITGIEITDKKTDITLDTIKLYDENNTTDEIDVVDQKSLIESKDDKLVFNNSQDISTKGGTALDVLRKVPLVTIDGSDNISIRGNNAIKILINGKNSNMYKNLKQVPAEMVEKVEVITNPSAKYDAEGTSGILNIILKKDNSIGSNGSVFLSSGLRDNYNVSANLNVKKSNVTFGLNTYAGKWAAKSHGSTLRENFNPDSISSIQQDFTGDNVSLYGGLNPTLDIDLDKYRSLNFEANFNISKYTLDNRTDAKNIGLTNNIIADLYRKNDYKFDYRGLDLSTFYQEKFKDPEKELSIEGGFTRNTNDVPSEITNSNILYPSLPNTFRVETTNNLSQNYFGQLDFQTPLGGNNSIETGFKYSGKSDDNDFSADSLNSSTGMLTPDIGVSNRFIYKENIGAGYFTFKTKLADISIKAGVRGEYSNVSGDVSGQNLNFDKNYFDLFPSVNISKKIGMADQIKFNYTRRLNRPNSWNLNPFITRFDPTNVSQGNPELDPEYTNSFELGYSKFITSFSITPTFFYRKKSNVISRYAILTDSNVTYTTYKNFDSKSEYGMDLIIGGSITKWWSLNTTLSYYKTEFPSGITQSSDGNSGYSYKANVSTNFVLPYGMNLNVFYMYNGDMVNAQGTSKGAKFMQISLGKSILQDKGNLYLGVHDALNQMGFESEIEGPGFRQTYKSFNEARNVSLSFTYRFGKMDNKPPKKKKNQTKDNTAPPVDGMK
ncbi:outer membrane beta-barrel family protein [soil metagenome]